MPVHFSSRKRHDSCAPDGQSSERRRSYRQEGSSSSDAIDLDSPITNQLSPIDLDIAGTNRHSPIDLDTPGTSRHSPIDLDDFESTHSVHVDPNSHASSYLTTVEWQSVSSGDTLSEQRSLSSRAPSPDPEDVIHLPQDKIDRLENSRSTIPSLLFRAYSTTGGRRSKGHSSQSKYLPAVAAHSFLPSPASLHEMTIPEVQKMAGYHLAWQNPNQDNFISWTRSILFAIEHALGRSRKNQTGCHIAVIEPARAVTGDGEMAPFYRAIDILDVYDIPKNPDLHWKVQSVLHPRAFTHEILSHGIVNYPDTTYRHVPLQEILDLGLFDIYPEFSIPISDKPDIVYQSSGLLTRCTALRHSLFPRVGHIADRKSRKDFPWEMDIYTRPHRIPRDAIVFAFSVAKLFVNNDHKGGDQKPPLHIALMVLALRRRPLKDPLLAKTIARNYCADDLRDFLYKGMSEVPDNLPEVMQYLELVRYACSVLAVPEIAPTVVDMGDLTRPDLRYRLEDDKRKPEGASARKGPALYTIDNDRTEMSRSVGPDHLRRGKRTLADFLGTGGREGSEMEPICL